RALLVIEPFVKLRKVVRRDRQWRECRAQLLQNVHQFLSTRVDVRTVETSDADLQLLDVISSRVPIERYVGEAHAPTLGLRKRGHHHPARLGVGAHGARAVIGPSESHRAVSAEGAERWPQSSQSVSGGWAENRSLRFGADRKPDTSSRCCR